MLPLLTKPLQIAELEHAQARQVQRQTFLASAASIRASDLLCPPSLPYPLLLYIYIYIVVDSVMYIYIYITLSTTLNLSRFLYSLSIFLESLIIFVP